MRLRPSWALLPRRTMSNNVVAPQRRLNAILRSLATTAQPELGRVTIGDVSTAVLESATPSRLPLLRDSLSITDAFNIEHLRWMLQKTVLGQDIFLIGPPGAYARRLALTLCRVLNQEFELVSLHRDVGESELKQGREIREGGTLEYVDSATMRAVKEGRILILEGIEKAERGIVGANAVSKLRALTTRAAAVAQQVCLIPRIRRWRS